MILAQHNTPLSCSQRSHWVYGFICGEAFYLHSEIEAGIPFQFQVPMICLLHKGVGCLFHCVSFLWISSLETACGFDRLGARHDGDSGLAVLAPRRRHRQKQAGCCSQAVFVRGPWPAADSAADGGRCRGWRNPSPDPRLRNHYPHHWSEVPRHRHAAALRCATSWLPPPRALTPTSGWCPFRLDRRENRHELGKAAKIINY